MRHQRNWGAQNWTADGERQYSAAELLEELADPNLPRKLGVPHPLSNFAHPNFVDGACADIIADFIGDTVFYEPDSMAYQGARWFLLESDSFFYACAEAGLDGSRLREHVRNKLA